MTPEDAKRVLMLYRPGAADAGDPEFAEALELARNNADLRAWFEQHCAFQTAMRDKFRQIAVAPDLKARLVASQKVIPLRPWRRRAAWMAAAAAIVLLLVLAGVLFGPRTVNRFADYRSKMIRTVLREYRMDIVTNNMLEVRRFLKARGAPSDYAVPAGMQKLQLTGAGLLRWRSNPVSMVCFDRGDSQMLFLFVMKQSAVADSPAVAPQVTQVKTLQTVSWTEGDNTYVLAGPDEPGFAAKYR